MKRFKVPTVEAEAISVSAMPTLHPALVVISGGTLGALHLVTDDPIEFGRDDDCDVVADDVLVSGRHCRITRRADQVLVEDLGSTNGTWVNGVRIRMGAALHNGDRIGVGADTMLRFTRMDRREVRSQLQLYSASVRDALTGAYNQRFFSERLEAEVASANRHGTPLALLLLDVDEYKTINDTYGHPAGDAVLESLASTVQSIVRVDDVFARYGGDEFAVLARGLEPGAALVFGERLRTRVESAEFSDNGHFIHVSVSVGIANLVPPHALKPIELLRWADSALYQAKRHGRNRVRTVMAPTRGARALRRRRTTARRRLRVLRPQGAS